MPSSRPNSILQTLQPGWLPILAAALMVGGCQPPTRHLELVLSLSEATPCRPALVDQVQIQALGDFPTRDPFVALLRPGQQIATLDQFPVLTEQVSVQAWGRMDVVGEDERWHGGAIVNVPEQAGQPMMLPLLRFGQTCAVADPDARFPSGANAVALSDGSLYVTGVNLPQAYTYRPGDRLAQPSEARPFFNRVGATATVLPDDRILFAGGAASSGTQAFDNAELLSLDGSQADLSFLGEPRRDHSALLLRDHSILLVGGQPGPGGSLILAAERLLVDAGSVRSVPAGSLPAGRIRPTLMPTEDGGVLVVGGVDQSGAPIGTVHYWDPRTSSFELRSTHIFPRGAATAILPGDRLLIAGGVSDEGGWSGQASILLPGGRALISLGTPLPIVEDPTALGTADGSALIVGRDPITGLSRATLYNPSTGSIEEIKGARLPTQQLRLADGVIVQGDDNGLSLLRLEVASIFDNPPSALFPGLLEDRRRLVLDSPPAASARWRSSGGRLIANVDGARLDIPRARFADFDLTLVAEGPLTLLLTSDVSTPVEISLSDTEGSDCHLSYSSQVSLQRRAGTLLVRAGEMEEQCTFDLPHRVGVALRARAGTSVQQIAISRL